MQGSDRKDHQTLSQPSRSKKGGAIATILCNAPDTMPLHSEEATTSFASSYIWLRPCSAVAEAESDGDTWSWTTISRTYERRRLPCTLVSSKCGAQGTRAAPPAMHLQVNTTRTWTSHKDDIVSCSTNMHPRYQNCFKERAAIINFSQENSASPV